MLPKTAYTPPHLFTHTQIHCTYIPETPSSSSTRPQSLSFTFCPPRHLWPTETCVSTPSLTFSVLLFGHSDMLPRGTSAHIKKPFMHQNTNTVSFHIAASRKGAHKWMQCGATLPAWKSIPHHIWLLLSCHIQQLPQTLYPLQSQAPTY